MRAFFRPPKFADEDQTRLALRVYVLCWALAAAITSMGIAQAALQPLALPRWLFMIVVGDGASLAAYLLSRRGCFRWAAVILLVMQGGLILALAWTAGGASARAVQFDFIPVFVAGMLLGGPAGPITAGVFSLGVLGLAWAGARGLLPPSAIVPGPFDYWLINTGVLGMVVVVERLSSYFTRTSFEKARQELHKSQQAESALRQSEAQFRATFENTLIGQYRTTPDGRILMGNPALCRMMGYPSLAALQQIDLEAEFRAGYPRADFKRELETKGVVVGLETTWTRLDGTVIYCRENARAVRAPSGEMLYYDGTIEDITERMRAEQLIQAQNEQRAAQNEELRIQDAELRAAQAELRQVNAELEQRVAARTEELRLANAALVRASRMKDEFLANMSHELRTPLTGILGLSEVLEMEGDEPLTNKQRHWVGEIRRSGEHLLALITDILDLAKVEAGKMELKPALVAVDEVCQASLRMIHEVAVKKKLRVICPQAPSVKLLQADERRLKQILVNLLFNAVKFTAEEGTIGLEVAGDIERQEVRFTVWDTGIGIAPENQAKLFKPFVQLDSRLSREYPGTGLGLALVAQLAELHGGRVELESEGVPGKGSRFTVVLPWQTLPAPGLAAAAPRHPAARRAWVGEPIPLILLADDNEVTTTTLQQLLQTLGYSETAVARNGREALALARKRRPALILMDIQMPEMDGLAATAALRADADAAVAATPVIALTALAMAGDRERCLAAGANDYLSKPMRLDALAQAMAQQLRWG